MCNIIFNTDCEFSFLIVVVYSNDLSRCCIFRTKSITSCVNRNCIELRSFKCCNNIQVQWLAKCSWLFCSVKNRNLLNCIRDSVDQSFCAEWSVKTNFNNSDFLSCSCQVIDCLLDCVTNGSHSYDHVLCICCSIVVEQFVVCSDLSVNFVHVFLYDCRHSIVVWVTCFSCLEEDIWVLSGTSLAWMVWI